MNKTKSFRRIAVLVLALALMTTTILCGTFAKYTTTFTPAGTLPSAAWNVTVNDGDADSATLNMVADNYTHVAYETAGTPDKIAPGTSGSFNATIANAGDVDLKYTFTFVVGQDFANNTNIVFYTNPDDVENSTLTATNGTYTVTTDDELTTTTGSETVTVYWTWNWVDAAENDYAYKQFTITATVVADQMQPQEVTPAD